MAYYAALVSLIQLLKEITHHDRYPNSLFDKQKIESLYKKFNILQEILDDYSLKDHKEESNDILERRIRDAGYRAQDIIEFHISNQIQKRHFLDQIHPRRHFSDRIHLFHIKSRPPRRRLIINILFSVCPIVIYVVQYFWLICVCLLIINIVKPACWLLISVCRKTKAHRELEQVKEEVDSIVAELMRIKESHTTHKDDLHLNSYISADSAGGASKVKEMSFRNTMVGFEVLRTTINEQLCGQSSRLEAISIVGMGGLGKTTLARNIFDDKFVGDHFDCRVWVAVSQNCHLRNILLAVIDSLNIEIIKIREADEGELVDHIHKHLFGRRYLIVMDDMWETKVWDGVKRMFPDNSNRSRIMITTRLSNVADYAGKSSFVHEMQFLNEDQSWNLLREKVFAQEHCSKELEVIGKSIAKNCRGLPLAIVVIAGVLSNVNRTQYDWEKIARNVSSVAIDQNDEHLSKILSLSYNHLPHNHKSCFLYLGGFPEDYEIPISKLIKLWDAEGFLKPIGSKSLEEVGEEYFKDLVNRNLVLITRKKSNGKFKHCIIHDLLRDLCLRRAHYEEFLFGLEQIYDFHPPTRNVRRIYVPSRKSSSLIEKHGPHVRSIISFESDLVPVESSCKHLRILDTINTRDSPVSRDAMSELLHLRYLVFRTWYPIDIPPSIFKLRNLQTLNVMSGELTLPSEIWKMPHLKHVMSRELTLPPIPCGKIRIADGVPLLGRLQTLWMVKDFIFTAYTIEMIPSLKKLKITYNHITKEWEDFGLDYLVHLHQIEKLEICFYVPWWKAASLPENFAFPSALIKLSLRGCGLPWKDMTVVGSLPNLQVLKLRLNAFVGEEWEPIEGEFLKLKFLLMEDLRNLKYWRAESIHFPCLEQLHIRECYELKEIPPEIGDISTLQLIELYKVCNKVLVSSALKLQEEQRELGNDELQVRVHI